MRQRRISDPVPSPRSLAGMSCALLSDPEVQTILSLIGDGVISTDGDGTILYFNPAAETMFGYSAAEVVGQPVELLMPQHYRDDHKRSAARFAASARPEPRLMGARRDVVGRRKSGEEFPLEATLSRQDLASGRLLTVVIRDVSERKQREEEQQLIAGELAHRIRNLMTIVTSLVSLTACGSHDVDGFRDTLLARLMAISRANDALIAGAWRETQLRPLIDAELEPFRTPRTPIILEGPKVRVSAKMAIALGLVMHELATNAAKYGALSCAGGRVEVDWSLCPDGQLAIHWREREGPPVRPPVKAGFGTEMIRRTLAAQRGEASMHYNPSGFECGLRVPGGAP